MEFRILPPLLPLHSLQQSRLSRFARHNNRPHNQLPRLHDPPIPHITLLNPGRGNYGRCTVENHAFIRIMDFFRIFQSILEVRADAKRGRSGGD
jgi:hypothetical protein